MTQTMTKTSVYEAMFLVNQSEASDFGGLIEHVLELLARGEAEILAMQKWDERRLAYEIDKQKRGVYILVYFRCEPTKVAEIERFTNISERIMRLLIVKADHLTEEEIASFDDREGLKIEAKLRAERAAEEGSQRSTVSLGAPDRDEPQDEVDTGDEDEDDTGDDDTN